MIIGIIVGIAVIGIVSYAAYKYFSVTKGEAEVNRIFTGQQSAESQIVRSKFFPDLWYVGKTFKLDSTLRVMFPNALIAFPTDILTIKEFRYFDIDGNDFEEVIFEKQGDKTYIMLYDKFEHNIYFLNRVMSQYLNAGDTPPMAQYDSIPLEENGNEYVYADMSGLLEVQVSGKNISRHGRLIRVYEREVTPEDNEYLICMLDKKDTVDYFIGFFIDKSQLEDL